MENKIKILNKNHKQKNKFLSYFVVLLSVLFFNVIISNETIAIGRGYWELRSYDTENPIIYFEKDNVKYNCLKKNYSQVDSNANLFKYTLLKNASSDTNKYYRCIEKRNRPSFCGEINNSNQFRNNIPKDKLFCNKGEILYKNIKENSIEWICQKSSNKKRGYVSKCSLTLIDPTIEEATCGQVSEGLPVENIPDTGLCSDISTASEVEIDELNNKYIWKCFTDDIGDIPCEIEREIVGTCGLEKNTCGIGNILNQNVIDTQTSIEYKWECNGINSTINTECNYFELKEIEENSREEIIGKKICIEGERINCISNNTDFGKKLKRFYLEYFGETRNCVDENSYTELVQKYEIQKNNGNGESDSQIFNDIKNYIISQNLTKNEWILINYCGGNPTQLNDNKYQILTGAYLLSKENTQEKYLKDYITGSGDSIGQLDLGSERWKSYTESGETLDETLINRDIFLEYLEIVDNGFSDLEYMNELMVSDNKKGIGYLDYCAKNPLEKYDENGIYCDNKNFKSDLIETKGNLADVQNLINRVLLEISIGIENKKEERAIVCPPGKGWTNNGICETCKQGTWNNGIFLSCQRTNPGKYTFYKNGFKVGQKNCEEGTFSKGGAHGDNGLNNCEEIPTCNEVIKNGNGERINIQTCQSGEYQDETGQDNCKTVQSSFYSSIINGGVFSPIGACFQSLCKIDNYCEGGINSPQICPNGKTTGGLPGQDDLSDCN